MDHRTALLSEIDAFIATRRMAETTFGRLAVNDGKFVARLRDQGNITFSTAERVRAFIEAQTKAAAPVEAT
jgi:hypothetical protein